MGGSGGISLCSTTIWKFCRCGRLFEEIIPAINPMTMSAIKAPTPRMTPQRVFLRGGGPVGLRRRELCLSIDGSGGRSSSDGGFAAVGLVDVEGAHNG